MLKSKFFLKKTRSGSIVKITREHYLRDDVWCGSEGCTKCKQENPVLTLATESLSILNSNSHYIVLDTNAILHQMDVLEESPIKNVIMLQTVLKEVKHQSYTAYKRIREIIGVKERRFYVFTNEHHKETYIERLKGETPNDYNDRSIRQATKWYSNHLKKYCKGGSDINDRSLVILLTNDAKNKELAIADGVETYTVHEYIKSLVGYEHLIEKLAKNSFTREGGGKILFPEHQPLSAIQTGLKTQKYLQGTFFASRDNYLEGYIRITGKDREIFVQGLANLNRAIQDDLVAVEVLPKNEWFGPSSLILDEKDEDYKDEEQNEKHKTEVKRTQNKALIRETGKVVGIIKRNWRPYCGMLSPKGNPKALRHLFIAANRQIPRIVIESRQGEYLSNKKIIVSIDAWPRNSRFPQGHYVRDLGECGNKETENEVLLLEHDIPHQSFSQNVLNDLPKMPWTITDKDYEERRDLRQLNICSIDPPGCTDIDDALHWRQLENGNFECGVHIADVTHFVKPGTHLDEEAVKRGTTVYLVDQRIDMLPDLLSSDLCSLHEKVERFAFSCVWELTSDAEIVNVQFFKSIILSKKAMTYAEAQMIIDDQTRNDEMAQGLRHLNMLAKKLKKKRMEAGALTLASTEVRFHIDSETHDPIDLQSKQLMDTNSLVEEFMLLANCSVAKRIYEHFPQYAVLRKHPEPSASMFESLLKSVSSHGIDLDVSSGLALQKSLDKATFDDDPYKNVVLRIITTRSMTQALYMCSGSEKYEDYFHYGLAAPIYTHFTSPIRRYPDVMVHRLLAVACGAATSTPEMLDITSVGSKCNHMNYRHKMAQYAGRASVNLHTQIFFKNRVCDEDGYVIKVCKNALSVLIPKYGLEGTLYVKDKKSDQSLLQFDENTMSLTYGNIRFQSFHKVTVQISIEKKDVQTSEMKLKLVYPVIPGLSVPPSQSSQSSVSEPKSKKKKR